jgi:glutamate/tyrosine decarboxylase-like PLP-dependent enzyme
LLQTAAALAVDYFESLRMRGVAPTQAALERLRSLDRPLPDGPADPMAVLQELHAVGSSATMATTGGRFFGFVVGGTLPTALAASWLAAAWDLDAGLSVLGPGAAALEEVALRWLLEALDLPTGCAGGFVTGATMANFTALAAARHEGSAPMRPDVSETRDP